MANLHQQIREAERAGEWDRASYLRSILALEQSAVTAANDIRNVSVLADAVARQDARAYWDHLNRMQRVRERLG